MQPNGVAEWKARSARLLYGIAQVGADWECYVLAAGRGDVPAAVHAELLRRAEMSESEWQVQQLLVATEHDRRDEAAARADAEKARVEMAARLDTALRGGEWLLEKWQGQQRGNLKKREDLHARGYTAEKVAGLAAAVRRHAAGETWEAIALGLTPEGGEALRKQVERARRAGVKLPAGRRPRG
jgi:hypothetical protein